MERPIIVRGRLNGARRIDLDDDVDGITGPVEVVLRPLPLAERGAAPARRKLLDVLRSFPPGMRSRDELDRQLVEERASWGSVTRLVPG